ncbi:MAG: c-type cytochrome biogenesis protein CcmI [Limnohabitans sp.]
MNPTLIFLLSALAMVFVVLTVICVSLWRGSQLGADASHQAQENADDPVQANAAVYKDQIHDLEKEYVLGNLSSEELQIAKDELARRLLDDVGDTAQITKSTPQAWRAPWIWVMGFVFLVPVAASVMYAVMGQPLALNPAALQAEAEQGSDISPEKMTEMATALMRRLQDEPNQIDGWIMLARVQRAREHFDESDEAFRKALALSKDDNLAIEHAEVLAQKNQGNFAGQPWAIIQRVLTADPQHLNALLLAGSASYSELNYRSALRFWERAREVVEPASPDAPELDRAIAQTREKMGLPSAPTRSNALANAPTSQSATSSVGASNNQASSARISGRVSVIKELADKVAPTDTVFVFATPVSGSRMPLAIVRTTADKLPFDFVLDDSTSMNPAAKLSSMAEVTVKVRISKSGQAMAQPGDLGVSLTPVKLGSSGLNLMVREPLQ